MRNFALAVLSVLAVASCSHPSPPQGRWEGHYESDDAMIVARLEIGADGKVRVSAPDLLDIAGASDEDRQAMRQRLAEDLAQGWDEVAPRAMDFDGGVFRKPGGVAPQAIWDAKSRTMQLVVYLGARSALNIPMRAVGDFSDNPWSK
ncbi:MAG TPA: hypothetical protein VG843_10850 [Rhizomicrobium sp.]|jgi:hypothetical protein|nr:hypothetical protein [Rhizomicrobium sp.]